MPGKIVLAPAPQIPTGSARHTDVWMQVSGGQGSTADLQLIGRGGVQSGAGLTQASCTVNAGNARLAAIADAQIILQRPIYPVAGEIVTGAFPEALVRRVVATWLWKTASTPADDSGFVLSLQGNLSAASSLLAGAGGNQGAQGIGILMIDSQIQIGLKQRADAAGSWSDLRPIPLILNNWIRGEFRLFDATDVRAARCEVWVNSAKIITYPFGTAGVTVPAPGQDALYAFAAQLRNDVGGPELDVRDFRYIVGPDEAGTY